jgi:2-ketocyclohexanecarboxyl-CoA hydrolase
MSCVSDATGPMKGTIHIEDRGESRWITLENGRARNAYDQHMAAQVAEALDGCSDVRSVVITGSPGAFCAGGMLAGLSAPTARGMRELYRASLRMFDAVRSCPRPVIAAVNGAAAGGGNELVVACDLAIAAESATFGQTGPRVGSAPVTGATNVMGVQIGEKRAKELSFLCRRYSAAQALDLGLVNAVVADDRLEAEVDSWCQELHRLSPRYLEIAKVSSNIWWNNARDNFAQGVGMLVQAIGSDDMREGAAAFLDKRPARFTLDPGEFPSNGADSPTLDPLTPRPTKD